MLSQTVIGDVESYETEKVVTTLPLEVSADILLMVEVSPELSRDELTSVLHFLTTFTNAFQVGSNYTRYFPQVDAIM